MNWDQVFGNICDSILKVTAKYEGGAVSATGFLVARYKQPGKLAFALATAEHVFRPLPMYTDVEWMLQRYNWKGQGTGHVTFKSNLQKLGASPIRANLKSDVGLLFLPKLAFETKVVRLLHPNYAIQPGAKVGWAGFPDFVSKTIGGPFPCYFEGVVSAVIDRVEQDGTLFYLVDGHGGTGVSGGPLWCWNDALGDYEVIGLCSKYILSGNQAPGVVAFESINRIVRYLETSGELEMRIASDSSLARDG